MQRKSLIMIVLLLSSCGGISLTDQSDLIHDTRLVCEQNKNIPCIKFVRIADDYLQCKKALPWWKFGYGCD